MANIFCADCGFNPHNQDVFKKETITVVTASDGFSLAGKTNVYIDVPTGTTSAIAIASFLDMHPGKEYKIIVKNASSTKVDITFPSGTLVYGESDAAANGDIYVYRVFTDGEDIYAEKSIIAA